MKLSRTDQEMLDGHHGPARQRAMEGLVTLGQAYDAPDLVDIGYAHIHAGMAMYKDEVELMEELADAGATVSVPSWANIANPDTVNWRQTGAPDPSVVQGAILSGIPVVCEPSEDVLATIADGALLRVDGAAGSITIEQG